MPPARIPCRQWHVRRYLLLGRLLRGAGALRCKRLLQLLSLLDLRSSSQSRPSPVASASQGVTGRLSEPCTRDLSSRSAASSCGPVSLMSAMAGPRRGPCCNRAVHRASSSEGVARAGMQVHARLRAGVVERGRGRHAAAAEPRTPAAGAPCGGPPGPCPRCRRPCRAWRLPRSPRPAAAANLRSGAGACHGGS